MGPYHHRAWCQLVALYLSFFNVDIEDTDQIGWMLVCVFNVGMGDFVGHACWGHLLLSLQLKVKYIKLLHFLSCSNTSRISQRKVNSYPDHFVPSLDKTICQFIPKSFHT